MYQVLAPSVELSKGSWHCSLEYNAVLVCFPLVDTVNIQRSVTSLFDLRSTFLAKNVWVSYALGVYVFHLIEKKWMIFVEHQVFNVTVQWRSLRKRQGAIKSRHLKATMNIHLDKYRTMCHHLKINILLARTLSQVYIGI